MTESNKSLTRSGFEFIKKSRTDPAKERS
jgi:hypothetical protein